MVRPSRRLFGSRGRSHAKQWRRQIKQEGINMTSRNRQLNRALGLGIILLLTAGVCIAADGAASASPASAPGAKGATDAISALAQTALAYAAVLAAAGTVSMAFVELVKGVFDLRRYFQQSMLSSWLGTAEPQVLPELLYLAIGDRSHESVLCGQPLEKMMGQLQAAARIALDYPEKFPRLFGFLSSTDFESNAAKEPVGYVAPADRKAWAGHAQAVRDISARLREAGTGATPAVHTQDAQAASDAAQARARLASLVGRKLDGFQLRVDFWWSRLNQALSIGISIVIVEYAVSGIPGLGTLSSLLLGLIGGLLAPFAKDFSQSLAKFATK
jgi:hypothetical protein